MLTGWERAPWAWAWEMVSPFWEPESVGLHAGLAELHAESVGLHAEPVEPRAESAEPVLWQQAPPVVWAPKDAVPVQACLVYVCRHRPNDVQHACAPVWAADAAIVVAARQTQFQSADSWAWAG